MQTKEFLFYDYDDDYDDVDDDTCSLMPVLVQLVEELMAVHTVDNWLGEEEEPSKEEPSKEKPRGEEPLVEAGGEQCKAALGREGEL